MKLRWEFMGHNESNTRRLNTIPPEEERRVIHDSLARIEKATGKKPVGWLGAGLQETWNTLDYLVEEGCKYVADWVNDDQPYRMTTAHGELYSIPYSVEINDRPAYDDRKVTPPEFARMIRDQFDRLYGEGRASGRVMAICLHPWISGVPHRIRYLEEALAHINGHERIWWATGSEIVDAYVKATI